MTMIPAEAAAGAVENAVGFRNAEMPRQVAKKEAIKKSQRRVVAEGRVDVDFEKRRRGRRSGRGNKGRVCVFLFHSRKAQRQGQEAAHTPSLSETVVIVFKRPLCAFAVAFSCARFHRTWACSRPH
jgi:hypothetical protein